MPITINGSTGIAGIDGSAGTPALQGSDTNTGIAFGADVILASTGGTERWRVDSSGRLLVGTSTATNNLRLQESFAVTYAGSGSYGGAALTGYSGTTVIARPLLDFNRSRGTTDGSMTVVASGDMLGSAIFRGSDGTQFVDAAIITCEVDGTPGANDMPGRLIFSTTADGASSPTERMRITNSGVVSISGNGATGAGNNPKLYVDGIIENNAVAIFKGVQTRAGFSGAQGANNFNIGWTGSVAQLWVDSSNLGTITTSSDYRIKHKIQPMQSGCIDRVKQLRPVQYELNDYGQLFRADGVVREGFIAHEVQSVIPSGADGVKDEENRIQNLRTDAIVAVLTKALQEAIAKIETLEAKVAALEVTP